MSTNKNRMQRGISSSNFQVKPIAQAVTLVCAGMAGNSAYADVCGPGTTTVSTDVSGDICQLDASESLDVTALGIIAFSGAMTPTSIPAVAVAATGATVAGSITNAGTIRGFNTSSNAGVTNIFLTGGYGIAVIGNAVIGGITNNAGMIIGNVKGLAATTSPVNDIYISVEDATGIVIDNSGSVTGGITNNGGTIAGIAEGYIHGATSSQPASLIGTNQDATVYATTAYGIAVWTNTSLSGGITNSGTITGQAIADVFVSNATSSVLAYAYYGYGIMVRGAYNDAGAGFNNNGGTISGNLTARAVNTNVANNVVTVLATGFSAYGVYLGTNADVTGSITNSGTIEATITAESIVTGMLPTATTAAVTVDDAYAYVYNAYGLFLENASVGGLFDNSGTVSGKIDLSIEVNDIHSIGTAYASAYNAYGIYMDNNAGFAGSFTNSGTISGDLDVSVALNNVLSNKTPTSYDVSAYAYYGYGIYANVAPIGIAPGDHFINNGSITGSVTASVDWEGATGSISQAYASVEYAYGISLNQSPIAGSLINSGSISGGLDAAVNIVGDTAGNAIVSGITPQAAQVYYAYGIYLSSSNIGGSLTNNLGTISASANASVSMENLASVSITISALASSAYGIYTNNSNILGDLTNSGTISSNAVADITLHKVLILDNASASAFNAYGIFAEGSIATQATIGSITNDSGFIKAMVSASVEVTDFTVGDRFRVSGSSAYGIKLNYVDVSGNIANSGTISAEAYANVFVQGKNPTTVELTISASASYAYGLTLENSSIGGDLDNSGTISATGVAEVTASDLDSLNSAFLSASGAYGIYMFNGDIDGALTNSGTISANMDARLDVSNVLAMTDEIYLSAYFAYGVYGYQTPIGTLTTDNFTNTDSGTISASVTASVNLEGLTDSFSSLNITASDVHAIRLIQSPIAGSLVNNGTISAAVTGTASVIGATTGSSPGLIGDDVEISIADAYGVYGYLSDIGGALTNGGTISGIVNASVHLENMYSKSSSFSVAATRAYGIYLNRSDVTGDLSNNTGTISGEVSAEITLRNVQYAPSYFSLSATYAYGIYAAGTIATPAIIGSITNNGGTIKGMASATADVTDIRSFYSPSADASRAYGISLLYADIGGGITNTGTIAGEVSADVSIVGKNPTTAIGSYVDVSASSAYGLMAHGLMLANPGGASLTNNGGTISAEADSIVSISNISTLDNVSARSRKIYGLYLYNSDLTGDLDNNAGIIKADALAKVDIQANVTRSANASATDVWGIRLNFGSSIGGDLTNSGTISAEVEADVNVKNGNGASNSFYAQITEVGGIDLINSAITGKIDNNAGTIKGVATAALHGATDAMELTLPSTEFGYAYAIANGIRIAAGSTVGDGIGNSGEILAQATADAKVNGGSVNATAIAIGLDITGAATVVTGDIVNTGTINALATATANGTPTGVALLPSSTASAYGIYINSSAQVTGIIDNTGTISGIASAANTTGYGIYVTNADLSTIQNTAGGEITGTTHGINISNATGGSVTIVNEGEDLLGNRSTISSINILTGEDLDISGLGGMTGDITGGGGDLAITGDGFTITGDISGFTNATMDDLATLDLDENPTSLTLTNNLSFGANLTVKSTINALDEHGQLSLAVSGILTEPTTLNVDIDASAVPLTINDVGDVYILIDGGSLTVSPGTPTDNNIGFDFTSSLVSGDLVVTVANVSDLVIADGEEEVALVNFDFDSVTIGTGLSGVLNQESGTITTDTLTINAGGIFNQSVLEDDGLGGFIETGAGVLNGGIVTLGDGASLSLVNQGTGLIDGASAGVGDLIFAGNYDTDSPIGETNALNSIMNKDGVTLTLDQNVSATTFTVGEGLSGIVNQIAGTVNVTDLIINVSGTYNQSGTGVLNASTSTITIATGSTLTLTNQGTGAIDGAGPGEGALVFAGNYDTDAPIGNTNSLASVTVNEVASLTLDQNLEATEVNINGGLNQSAGTLAAGAVSVAGNIDQSAGTMDFDSLILNSGASFTQTGAGQLSTGSLGISGTFNKENDSDLIANTTINSGGLLIVSNGFNHTGNLNVNGGNLSLGGVSVNVDGTFTLGAGATLSTTVNSGATDDAGRITATGATTVSANAKLEITVSENAVVEDGTTYKVIDGPAGGSGVNIPLTITDNSTELNFIASTDGSDLLLTAELAAVFGEAWLLSRTRSPNALSGFAVLREIIENDPELSNAFASITTVEEFEAALQTLLPDVSRALINITSFAGRSAVVSVINRLVAVRNGGTGFNGIAAGNHLSEIGFWLQGFGTAIDQDDRQGIAGFDADTYGLTFGMDKLVTDNLRLGGAFSFSGTNADTKGTEKNLDARNYQATIYGSYQLAQHHVDASISYGNNAYDSSRLISVGTLSRLAEASFTGNQIILQGQYGQVYTYNDDIFIGPYAGLYYSSLDIDDYTETRAGTVNLSVAAQSYESFESILGVSIRKEIESRNGTSLVPEVHASWRHEFIDDIQINTSNFSGGGASFITEGFTPASDSLNLGVSYSVYLQNNIDLKFSYDFETKSDYSSHSGNINIRYNF